MQITDLIPGILLTITKVIKDRLTISYTCMHNVFTWSLKESYAFLSGAESYYVKTKQIFNGISTRQESTHSTEPRQHRKQCETTYYAAYLKRNFGSDVIDTWPYVRTYVRPSVRPHQRVANALHTLDITLCWIPCVSGAKSHVDPRCSKTSKVNKSQKQIC